MLLRLRQCLPRAPDGTVPCTFAALQVLQLIVEIRSLRGRQGGHSIPLFERIDPQIIISDQTGSELAVEEIMRRVNGADARVGVVIGVHTETEWPRAP